MQNFFGPAIRHPAEKCEPGWGVYKRLRKKKVDVLAVWSPDRMARSLQQLLRIGVGVSDQPDVREMVGLSNG